MHRLAAAILSSLLVFAAALPAPAASITPEYVILVGGPSLMEWEKYKAEPHDHWWANFVRAGRIRTEQLRAKYGPDAKITWLVYKQGYIDRGAQEKMNLIEFIDSVRDKFNLNLVWFRAGGDVIRYLNSGQPRDQVKVAFFEYLRPLEQSLLHVRLQQQCRQRVKILSAPEPARRDKSKRLYARCADSQLGLPHRRDDVAKMARGAR